MLLGGFGDERTSNVAPPLRDVSQGGARLEDGGVVLVASPMLSALSARIQVAMRYLETWCQDTGLTVNPQKTEMVLFTNRRKLDDFTAPMLFGRTLELKDQVKYLGVILDKQLRWKQHLDRQCTRAVTALWTARRAVGKTWGLSPRLCLWVYTAIVRPMISYAAIVWWPRVQVKTAAKSLESIQRMACIAVTGALKTTPAATLEILLGIPPLDLFIQKEAMAGYYRLYQVKQWRHTGIDDGHAAIKTLAREQVPLLSLPSDHQVPVYLLNENDYKNFSTAFPSRESWTDGRLDGVQETLRCFTDGSRKDGCTGAGIQIEELEMELSVPMGKLATVFQAEVQAILVCAQELLQQGTLERKISIFSDSQAAIKALSANSFSSKLVWECRQTLKQLCARNEVRLIWVPGHCGIEGNEKADTLAKVASETVYFGPEPAVGISPTAIKMALKHFVNARHTVRWSFVPGCRQSKQLVFGLDRYRTKELLSLSRKQLQIATGILTGHCGVQRHLHLMGITDQVNCPFCGKEPETVEHFMCKCSQFDRQRQNKLGSASLTDMQELNSTRIKGLLSFVKSTGRFNPPDNV